MHENDTPNPWRRRYNCPVTTCIKHENGFATLKEKKVHISLKHADTKKAKR